MGRLTGKLEELKVSGFDTGESVRMMQEILEEMAGASEIPKIRATVAGGGTPVFSIKDSDDVLAEIEGIILFYRYSNAYWDQPVGQGDGIPQCSSMDGINGYTREGENRNCHFCPLNKMGSADGGNGKACKNTMYLTMLVEGYPVPVEVKVPTMSIKNYDKYNIMKLKPMGLKVNQVVTKLSVEKVSKSSTVAYGRIKFECAGRLSEGACADVQGLISAAKPLLAIEGNIQKEDGGVNG